MIGEKDVMGTDDTRHFHVWHPPLSCLLHIYKHNKHRCQLLLNFAIKGENKPLLF